MYVPYFSTDPAESTDIMSPSSEPRGVIWNPFGDTGTVPDVMYPATYATLLVVRVTMDVGVTPPPIIVMKFWADNDVSTAERNPPVVCPDCNVVYGMEGVDPYVPVTRTR